MINKTTEEKQVFTTGEAAKICNVSQQTIIRCFDNGRLQGFKVPGSRFRRIPRGELLRFMHDNKMDTSRLGSVCLQVLVIGLKGENVEAVINTFTEGHQIKITHAEDAWSAGFAANECKPGLILINPTITGLDARAITSTLSLNGGLIPKVVAISSNYQNDVNRKSNNTASREAIKQAVQQVLTA